MTDKPNMEGMCLAFPKWDIYEYHEPTEDFILLAITWKVSSRNMKFASDNVILAVSCKNLQTKYELY